MVSAMPPGFGRVPGRVFGFTAAQAAQSLFRLLLPLLTFGREREGVDLSMLKLTAYTVKSLGDATLSLGAAADPVKIAPTEGAGSNAVKDKAKIALAELIERVNDLFEGDLTPGEKPAGSMHEQVEEAPLRRAHRPIASQSSSLLAITSSQSETLLRRRALLAAQSRMQLGRKGRYGTVQRFIEVGERDRDARRRRPTRGRDAGL